jgi:hypothetical protein
VPQVEGRDYTVDGVHARLRARPAHGQDRLLALGLGAWGVRDLRQDDSVDVRYEHGGRARVAEKLPLRLVEEDED